MSTMDFRTRTDMIVRGNGQLPNDWIIALDIGYSSVKVYCPNKVASFPAYAEVYEDKGTVGRLPDDFIVYTDLDEDAKGTKWIVGRYAENDGTMTAADDVRYGRDRYFSPMFKVITRVGLAMGLSPNQYGSRENRSIFVQTGLPPQYIQKDTPLIREAMAGHHHFSIRVGSGVEQEYEFDLPAENVSAIPQPMGTLYSVLIDNNHHFVSGVEDYLNNDLLVFDPGFGTFDTFPLRGHKVGTSHTFNNLGMRQVLKDTADAIYRKYGELVGVSEMQKYLETGTVRCYDRRKFTTKDEPFEDLLKASVTEVCNAAIEQIAQLYQLEKIDYLILTGGTSVVWEPIIRDRFSGLSTLKIIRGNITDDKLPLIYANVRGYYQYRFSRIGKKQSQV